MNLILNYLYKVILQMPNIVLLIGIILSVILFRRHKLISIFAIIALTIQLLIQLSSSYISNWLTDMVMNNRTAPYLTSYLFTGVFSLRSILSTLSWILIIISIFISRNSEHAKQVK